MIKAVLFDHDGVVADSLETAFQIYQQAAEQYKQQPFSSIDAFRAEIHKGYRHILHELWKFTVAQRKTFEEMYQRRTGESEIAAVPGIEDAFASLSPRVDLGIASGNHVNTIELFLKRRNLRHHLKQVSGLEHVDNQKPQPDVIYHCLGYLGVTPDEALYVGDSVSDIKAGRAAGVRTLILPTHSWSTRDDIDAHKPDAVISHLCEVQNFL